MLSGGGGNRGRRTGWPAVASGDTGPLLPEPGPGQPLASGYELSAMRADHRQVSFRGDQTFAMSYLTVLPRGMECVVFSIDGSFAASVSIMGSDPKVRPGAVDVVR